MIKAELHKIIFWPVLMSGFCDKCCTWFTVSRLVGRSKRLRRHPLVVVVVVVRPPFLPSPVHLFIRFNLYSGNNRETSE